MVSVPKREFVVVESCFEVIFRHADVVTCSSGCCRDYVSTDDVIFETFSIKRAKVPVSAITCLFVVGHFAFNLISFCCGFLLCLSIFIPS